MIVYYIQGATGLDRSDIWISGNERLSQLRTLIKAKHGLHLTFNSCIVFYWPLASTIHQELKKSLDSVLVGKSFDMNILVSNGFLDVPVLQDIHIIPATEVVGLSSPPPLLIFAGICVLLATLFVHVYTLLCACVCILLCPSLSLCLIEPGVLHAFLCSTLWLSAGECWCFFLLFLMLMVCCDTVVDSCWFHRMHFGVKPLCL